MNTIRRQFSDPASVRPADECNEPEPCFRYPLPSDAIGQRPGINALLTDLLQELLDLLVPTAGGHPVRVDGCRPLNYPDQDLRFHSDPLENRKSRDLLDLYEPRLALLRRLTTALQGVVEFEAQGRPVKVDAVRLRHPEQWLSTGGGAADILAHAAARCNLNCRFCYNDGSPPLFKSKPRTVETAYREMLARIRHYQPATRQGLFPHTGSLCEALLHPRIFDILAALRTKTDEVIRIPTNGSLLSPKTVSRLSDFSPLFIDVSLNSSDPIRRRWLMRDPHPHVAIGSLAGLQAGRIPYSVVIVPWPVPSVEAMLSDLETTVFFSERYQPAFIQISLPGYSRFFSEPALFDRDRVWERIKAAVQTLRPQTATPLILRPGLFEEYLDPQNVMNAVPIGVVRNSPAARAGLLPGDRLLKVNGLPVKERTQARSLLHMVAASGLEKTVLCVQRQGRRLELGVDLEDCGYPYQPAAVPHLGAVFASAGIPPSWVEDLRALIGQYRAQRVLLLSSNLVRPTIRQLMEAHYIDPAVRIEIRVPENRYLGGNIFMGDLLTVSDFAQAVACFLDENLYRPDLIILPASPFHLSGWGRDLTAESYLQIERRFEIPVALIHCNPIFD